MTREKILSLLILFGLLLTQQCAYNDIATDRIECSESDLAVNTTTKIIIIGCVTMNSKIDVVALGGTPPYQYSIDDDEYQSENEFVVSEPGTYVVSVKDDNDCIASVDVVVSASESSLIIEADVTPGDPCAVNNGVISVFATGGKPPYRFSIGGGKYQEHGRFISLGAGSYILSVKDSAGCQASLEVFLQDKESNLIATTEATPDDQCLTSNGTIRITTTGGKEPYRYRLDGDDFKSSGEFVSVRHGVHQIIISDVDECTVTVSVEVPRGITGVSYLNDIKPMLDAHCNFSGCHGAGNGSRDWTKFDNVRLKAPSIKTRTSVRNMPPSGDLSTEQIIKIGCWVDDGALDN